MKNICTVSDYGYLVKGFALYESLCEHSSDFLLHYGCIDVESYHLLRDLNLDNLKPYPFPAITELCEGAPGYIHQETGNYTRWQHYCWSLSSRFCLWLMQNGYDEISYVDADLLFYHDIQLVYDEMKGKPIGITPHLHNTRQDAVGAYNVSFIYFSGDTGKECLTWWKGVVCNPGNDWYATHGMCGDQKYLDLFQDFHEQNVHVIRNEVAQGAPWNFRLYDWSDFTLEHRYIKYNGNELPLVWIHFSHFEPHFSGGFYSTGTKNYGNFHGDSPKTVDLYAEYWEKLKDAKAKYEI